MKKVIAYLLIFLALVTLGIGQLYLGYNAPAVEKYKLFFMCVLLGGIGGSLYCLRGVYLNYSVKGTWSAQWEPWYYIRPIVSLMCGGISFVFLKSGLLLLEAASKPDSSELGFMALALIAGLNVDKFISKIEDIAQASWGIEKSRASKES
jgi:hypothetical protein